MKRKKKKNNITSENIFQNKSEKVLKTNRLKELTIADLLTLREILKKIL